MGALSCAMLETGPKGGLWRVRKRVVSALFTAVSPVPPRAELDLSRPLRVAYLRVDRRVGEVLLQTPLFHAHKRARPQDTVLAVVNARMARVLEGQPGIDQVVPFAWRGFPVHPAVWRYVGALRDLRVDVAVDCSDPTLFSGAHALAARLTRAPVRASYNRGPAGEHFTHLVDVPTPLHEATARARLLDLFGIQGAPDLKWEPRDGVTVVAGGEDVLARVRAERGRHAVVVPGGRLAWRRLGPSHFGPLCGALAGAGRTPWLAPGPGEEELCRSVAQACPEARVLPVTDLHQLGALMRAADLTVCNNTGPMHLSVAVGARTFALFAVMDPGRWGHHQPGHHMERTDLEAPGESTRLVEVLRGWLAAGPGPAP
jgi:ADP-heptose:LPS heptosyltransferase